MPAFTATDASTSGVDAAKSVPSSATFVTASVYDPLRETFGLFDVVVAFELIGLAWIRWRFFGTSFVKSLGLVSVAGAFIALVGALVGGFLSESLYGGPGVTGLNLSSIVIAFLGAVVAIFIVRALSGGRTRV